MKFVVDFETYFQVPIGVTHKMLSSPVIGFYETYPMTPQDLKSVLWLETYLIFQQNQSESVMGKQFSLVLFYTKCIKFGENRTGITTFGRTINFGGKSFRLNTHIPPSNLTFIFTGPKCVYNFMAFFFRNCDLYSYNAPRSVEKYMSFKPVQLFEDIIQLLPILYQRLKQNSLWVILIYLFSPRY